MQPLESFNRQYQQLSQSCSAYLLVALTSQWEWVFESVQCELEWRGLNLRYAEGPLYIIHMADGHIYFGQEKIVYFPVVGHGHS